MAEYITPVVTPLLNGKIDYASAKKLYEHLINNGSDGILIFGSIGEFFAFDINTKKQLIEYAYQITKDKIKLIVGVTALVYNEIVELANYCYDLGRLETIIIPPYYFHYKGEDIYNYYAKLASDIKGNFYLYNFPDRTGYQIDVDVIYKLAVNYKNIIGIKDTIAGLDHTREAIKLVKPIRPDFKIYSGFDDNFFHNVLAGGDGCIAGLSNIYPNLTHKCVEAVNTKNMDMCIKYERQIDKLMSIYNVGKPFVPYIKLALKIKGIIASEESSIPMPSPTNIEIKQIKKILEEYEKNA